MKKVIILFAVVIPGLCVPHPTLKRQGSEKARTDQPPTISLKLKSANKASEKETTSACINPVTPNRLFSFGLNLMMTPVSPNNFHARETTLTF